MTTRRFDSAAAQSAGINRFAVDAADQQRGEAPVELLRRHGDIPGRRQDRQADRTVAGHDHVIGRRHADVDAPDQRCSST
jgi:hypothetical protein